MIWATCRTTRRDISSRPASHCPRESEDYKAMKMHHSPSAGLVTLLMEPAGSPGQTTDVSGNKIEKIRAIHEAENRKQAMKIEN